MTDAELHDVESELSKAKQPSSEQLRHYLRLVRELRLRDSENVAKRGGLLLAKYKSHLKEEELWLVSEQVAVAALDCQALKLAAQCIRNINKRFPDSARAKKLKGMFYEASGEDQKAEEIYTEILRDHPYAEGVSKRLVALEKARGNTLGAIEALKKYVEVYSTDKEAWEELADLYIEELLLHAPGQQSYHIRYADVLYTMGGPTNFRTARTYYAQVIELSGGKSLRALYGICACTAALNDKDTALAETCGAALMQLYEKSAADKLPMVKALLKSQGLL